MPTLPKTMPGKLPRTMRTSFPTDFADNPEQRCPCVLLLDTSYSMHGKKIDQMNEGLRLFRDELGRDRLAAKRVEVAVVGFGPAQVLTPFVGADEFEPETLRAEGDTPMGEAALLAIRMLEERKHAYRAAGITYYRPWVFLVTDGAPSDDVEDARALIHAGEAADKFSFFAVGVEGADMELLARLAVREPLRLRGMSFRELFQWLSASLRQVSASTPGTPVPLPSPAGWSLV